MKFLFLITALSLFIVGCNRGEDQAGATGSGAGLERQEEGRAGKGQSPGFEKEEYRVDDANITIPIDSRPDLEEEE